jgi:hypothetical protein
MNNNLLYVLQLENDKWFLHLSNMPEEYIFHEAKTLFEFVKKNNPIRIYETLKVSDNYEINSWAKRYMEYFGIENVRGGMYKNEILPDYLTKNILLEQQQNDDDIANIFYKLKDKTNLTEIDFKNQYELYCELDNLEYGKINRDLVSELEWLYGKVVSSQNDTNKNKLGKFTINQTDNNKYKLIMENLQYVSNVYFKLDEDKIKVKDRVFLRKPFFVFDSFFYHKINIENWENKANVAIQLIMDYEFMTYTIINIQDNLKFDLFN